jgi:hypothetical protein
MKIKKKLEVMKTKNGVEYIGIRLFPFEVDIYLQKWYTNSNTIPSDISIANLHSNRIDRDGESYHITILTPGEYDKFRGTITIKELLNTRINFDIEESGIGMIKKGYNESHFIVIDSLRISQIREGMNLQEKDLHITIGFHKKDVHSELKDKEKIYLEI